MNTKAAKSIEVRHVRTPDSNKVVSHSVYYVFVDKRIVDSRYSKKKAMEVAKSYQTQIVFVDCPPEMKKGVKRARKKQQ
jgi:hypothetical protein